MHKIFKQYNLRNRCKQVYSCVPKNYKTPCQTIKRNNSGNLCFIKYFHSSTFTYSSPPPVSPSPGSETLVRQGKLHSDPSHVNVYNSLTAKKEALTGKRINNSGNADINSNNYGKTLTWYSCGPTVYDDAHLGHARTYVCSDIIRRILSTSFNFNINFILGMTDVDDKIIKKGRSSDKANASSSTAFLEVARVYENDFFNDMDTLNVMRPTSVTRVSEYIPDIIKYIETIIDNGYAYESSNGVYFSCEQLGDQYGALARSKLDISAEQVETNYNGQHNSMHNGNAVKKDPRDFALWKKNKEEANVVAAGWDSPWGHGRPGWHIECSAMTHSIIGKSIDIHSGGIDLKFPHHNNEIAQCQAHNNCSEWVNTFIHFGHVHIDGLKMSKSLKNFVTIKQLFDHKTDAANDVHVTPDDFRLFCLLHHYRSNVTYSMDRIYDANAVRKMLHGFLLDISDLAQKKQMLEEETLPSQHDQAIDFTCDSKKRWLEDDITFFNHVVVKCKEDYTVALADDFNTPKAMQILRNVCNSTRKHIQDYDGIPPSELLLDIHNWVETALRNLGLTSIGSIRNKSSSCDANVQSESNLKLLKSFAEFRGNVRSVARGMEKSNEKFELLNLCDHIRDEVFPNHGYELRDDANNAFTIRKI